MAERLAAAVLPAFCAAAAREYELAAEHQRVVERTLRFGDRMVRLRVAGAGLADLLVPALAHRSDECPRPADVTISVWEATASPQPPVPVPWSWSDVGPGGVVRGPAADPMVVVHETGSGALTLVDPAARTVLHRVPGGGAMPWWERAAPLRPALFWALGGEGRHVVHAGAVGDDRGGVLLAGGRGSGKTTVVVAALDGGLGLVADDYLLLRGGSEWEAVSLYSTVCVLEPAAGAKTVLDVAAATPGALRESLPIRAVVAPRIRGGRACLRRASPAVALRAWAPSTAFHMPFDDGAVVASLAAIVRGVPCFTLDVGDDRAELASAMADVLEQVAA